MEHQAALHAHQAAIQPAKQPASLLAAQPLQQPAARAVALPAQQPVEEPAALPAEQPVPLEQAAVLAAVLPEEEAAVNAKQPPLELPVPGHQGPIDVNDADQPNAQQPVEEGAADADHGALANQQPAHGLWPGQDGANAGAAGEGQADAEEPDAEDGAADMRPQSSQQLVQELGETTFDPEDHFQLKDLALGVNYLLPRVLLRRDDQDDIWCVNWFPMACTVIVEGMRLQPPIRICMHNLRFCAGCYFQFTHSQLSCNLAPFKLGFECSVWRLAVTRDWLQRVHPMDYPWLWDLVGLGLGLFVTYASGLSRAARIERLNGNIRSAADDGDVLIAQLDAAHTTANKVLFEVFQRLMGKEWGMFPLHQCPSLMLSCGGGIALQVARVHIGACSLRCNGTHATHAKALHS